MKTTKLIHFFNLFTDWSFKINAILILLILFNLNINAQDPQQYGTPFANVPDTRDINMYQVHIRPFSAAGNLAGVTARLDKIKELGINVIYLMPIFPHGTDSRSTPSPYCIKDFKAVASEYGSLADFRQLVDGAHSRGMAVILDIAINGTSWDHPWTTQHPEYYLRSDGEIQQLDNYADVAALDLNNQGLRNAIKDAMRYWVYAANIDGYRCDYANKPPLDFWSEIIGDLRSIESHNLLMMAEGDRQENFTVGFDMNFGDRWFFNALKDVASGGPVSTRFQTINDYEYAKASGSQQAVRYTGNHDSYTNENGVLRPFVLFKNHNGVVVNFLVSAYMKGVPFLMSGQEIDYEPKTDWPWTNFKFDWSQNTAASADFAKILNFRTQSNAIRRGTLQIFPSNDISAFVKTSGSEKVVVLANLRNEQKSIAIPAEMAGEYNDAFTNATVTLSAGTVQNLAAFGYLVLTNTNVPTVPVTSISISPNNVEVPVGNTQILSTVFSPSNATNKNVTWSSSNTNIATVNSSGVVSAINVGTTNVSAKSVDGNHVASATINVKSASSYTVHFYKPSNWNSSVRIYWWEAQPTGILQDASWPGELMKNEGEGWYSYTFTNLTSVNLIFNDGDNQTANLSRGSQGWYKNETWHSSDPSSCTSTPIIPYLHVNGGEWEQVAEATLNAGDIIVLGPQPINEGSWSWVGPGGFTSTEREVSLSNLSAHQSGEYIVTHTNPENCTNVQVYNLTITGIINATAYRIKNRWQSVFLFDNGTQAAYGLPDESDLSAQWKIEDFDGYKVFKNLSSGNHLNIEDLQNHVQCSDVSASFWSAQWSVEEYDGYIRIRNRWHSDDYLHVEDLLGYAQYGNVYSGAHSNHWVLEPILDEGSLTVDIKNVNIFEDHDASFQLFPNPFKSQFVLQITGASNNATYQINVVDLMGEVVHRETCVVDSGDRMTHTIEAGFLNPGVYFIQVRNNQNLKAFKIVKE